MYKTNLLNKMEKYKPSNPDIELRIYEGYAFIHIDFIENGKEIIWTTISISDEKEIYPLELKICKLDDKFRMSKANMKYFKEMIHIIETFDVSAIFGRINIPEKYNKFESLFNELGFDFKVCNDKKYLTAKIKYTK